MRVTGAGHVLVDSTADRTTVVLVGEIDAQLSADLDTLRGEVLSESLAEHHVVRVDVGAVTFMDSTGLAFLVRLTQGLAPRRVVLVDPPDQVQFLLDVTRVWEIVDVEP